MEERRGPRSTLACGRLGARLDEFAGAWSLMANPDFLSVHTARLKSLPCSNFALIS